MNDQPPPLVRLIIRSHAHRTGAKSADRFDAHLGGEHICTSHETDLSVLMGERMA